ncbi:MAG TPA: hypothetical protein VE176_01850 [Candidatus Limnocylindrales bacterium]|jgi:hypothetical protein|nr:hypothetical protein [Candidatus Limnocylindrales bacterium]
MTIFGFNTDVKLADVVYHVQSEARQNDLLLQTLVFVKGQCVGKQAFSYAHEISHPGFSTEAMHELLKTQHKVVIDAIQQGQMSSVLGSGADVQDVGGSGLSLQWKSPAVAADASNLPINFQVLDSGKPASGAEIVVRGVVASDGLELARGVADASGAASLSIALTDDVLNRGAVMVQATRDGKSVTRKLRVKR